MLLQTLAASMLGNTLTGKGGVCVCVCVCVCVYRLTILMLLG